MTLPRAAERSLEQARRTTALQVDTLAHAVTSLDDEVGWARLTELGTASVVRAQTAALEATADTLNATLEAAGLVGDFTPDGLPIRPGLLQSGRPVRGMFAATPEIVARRMTGGAATFPEALDASAHALTGYAASEPHRIHRDAQLEVGTSDPRFGRYRRVAVGTTCTFCNMLATRGAVYLTAESAGMGRRYHRMCDCYVELVVDPAAIEASKSTSGDWRNAIRDQERLRAADVRREWAQMPDAFVEAQATAGSREAIAELGRRRATPLPTAPEPAAAPRARRADFHDVPPEDLPSWVKSRGSGVTAHEADMMAGWERTISEVRGDIQISEARILERKHELKHKYGLTGPKLSGAVRTDPIIKSMRDSIEYQQGRIASYEGYLAEKRRQIAERAESLLRVEERAARTADWVQGEPMQMHRAAEGTNMRWATDGEPYQINCTRAATTYELRRRGYDVIARPITPEDAATLNGNLTLENWRTADGATRRMLKPGSRDAVEAEILSWPEGARGFIDGAWNGGSGHIWNVERTSQGYRMVEAQTDGQAGPLMGADHGRYWDALDHSTVGVARVDDLVPTRYVGWYAEVEAPT